VVATHSAVAAGQTASLELPDEPPVVARLMVEIRSDGRRTVARGAIEDVPSGERVAVAVDGATPIELALSLARSVFTMPALARTALRALRKRN
jgi:hypothetical protein